MKLFKNMDPEGNCLYQYIQQLDLIFLRPLKNNVVFIYIHMGSEVDKVLYPQCETIVKYEQETGRKKGTVKSYFINMIVKLRL